MRSLSAHFSVFLYSITVNFYHFIICLISPFHHKARLFYSGRKQLFNKIESAFHSQEKIAWVHCSSLGEFEQGRPVIEAIKIKFPDYKIFLTFFSPSGYEIRKNYNQVDYVFYLPRDSRKNAEHFLDIIKPTVAIFIKYDFWYFYFNALKSRNIPLFVVSAIFHPNDSYFGSLKSLYRQIFSSVQHFFVQDDKSMSILKDFGFSNSTLAHDTRIDRVFQIAASASENKFPEIEKFIDGKAVLIAGSCYEAEEILVKSAFSEQFQNWKIILVPHHTEDSNIRRIEKLFEGKTIRYSELINFQTTDKSILIVDKIGILAFLYQYANIAFIGGGFGKGIHNTLEPACYGIPVICGPKNHTKFQEITDMQALGGLFIIYNSKDFEDILNRLIQQETAAGSGNICRDYIRSHTGGTATVMDFLQKYLA